MDRAEAADKKARLAPPPTKQGWLHKKGGTALSAERKRWFVLQGTLAKRCAAEPAIPANRASRASFASKALEATALPRLQRKAPSAAAL